MCLVREQPNKNSDFIRKFEIASIYLKGLCHEIRFGKKFYHWIGFEEYIYLTRWTLQF